MEVLRTLRKFLPWLKRLLKAYIVYKFFRVWFPRKVKSVKGATVLVTGASGGLGTCICKELAKRGASKLVLWDLNKEGLENLSSELRRQYPTLKAVTSQKVNLADREEIYKESKIALDSVGGRMDVVVNNAGLVTGQNFLDTPDKKNELTMAVNTMAHMWTTKAFLPGMLENSGGPPPAFLNISSMASYMGAAQMVDYATSKFAARGFSEALAAELKQLGVWQKCKVSCICPSHMDTKLFKGFHVTGTITMTPEFVAEKVVTAYECEQELVQLPRHLTPAVVFMALSQALGSFNLPNPNPSVSPLANFDRTQADAIVSKMNDGPYVVVDRSPP